MADGTWADGIFGRMDRLNDQIARIGNSVCPPVAEALVRANVGVA